MNRYDILVFIPYPWLIAVLQSTVARVVDPSVWATIFVVATGPRNFPSGHAELFRVANLDGVDNLVIATPQVTNKLLVLLVVLQQPLHLTRWWKFVENVVVLVEPCKTNPVIMFQQMTSA